MSYAAPFPPPPSPAPFFLSANNLRLAEQDLSLYPPLPCGLSASIMPTHPPFSPSSLSFSSASLNRTPFADLLHLRTTNVSPLQSPRNRAVSSPRSLSSLGSDVRPRFAKENRGFTTSKSRPSACVDKGPIGKKRPAKLAIPESARLASLEKAKQFEVTEQDSSEDFYTHEAALFAVSSKKGRKDRMEDAYTASTHCQGDSKQAFFGVFDGHGGKHAADFAAANLCRHISAAIQNQQEGQACLRDAMRRGYITADAEFLNQRRGSGACAVSAFIKEGEMVVANAGDCKAVLCRAGKAESLSTMHRASNEAEKQRVEDLGGFVDCINGVWRVQNTLAVTRGFGDASLKKWVSAEPAVKKIDITRDCEFLILASDGLWDQMNDQEAVDCAWKILVEARLQSNLTQNGDYATENGNHEIETASIDHISDHLASVPTTQSTTQNKPNASFDSAQDKKGCALVSKTKANICDELIRIACQRGTQDDITVMIVLLQDFVVA